MQYFEALKARLIQLDLGRCHLTARDFDFFIWSSVLLNRISWQDFATPICSSPWQFTDGTPEQWLIT